MRRFCLPPPWPEGPLPLPPAEAHHAMHVLRLKVGQEVMVFDGQGLERRCRIASLSPSGGTLEPSAAPRRQPPSLELVLGQGLARGEKLELVLQHGTELGLTAFYPLSLERSVLKLAPEKVASRVQRWQRIAQEAAKQCRWPRVPDVKAPTSLEDFCTAFQGQAAPRLGLVLDESLAGDAPLTSVVTRQLQPPRALWLLVGPEGGLTRGEADLAVSHGFFRIGLGPRILRTETAALAGLTLAQYLFGDLSPRGSDELEDQADRA